MIYCFSNRRRAKDTIMLILDKYGEDSMTVSVSDGLVYVDLDEVIPDVDTVMHYAALTNAKPVTFTELYRGVGLAKFRV